MSKEAIVLAGGSGTRLKAVLSDMPKPMAPIGNEPFLAFLLNYLIEEGIEHVVLSVGYKFETIRAYFGKNYKGMKISYCVEETPLGTGGGIKAALSYCDSDFVFVINGDTYFDVSLEMMRNHVKEKDDLLIALCPMKKTDRYGSVELDKSGNVLLFKEKEFFENALINGGVYLMSVKIFDNIKLPEKFSFEKDIMEFALPGMKKRAMVFENYFIDIGVPDDYLRAQIELPEIFK